MNSPSAREQLAVAGAPASERARAFGLSWFTYASYYLGRKGFSVVKSSLSRQFGFDPAALALIDSVYLLAYALGQLPSGLAVDRWGSRRVLTFGLLLSAAACAVFGASAGLLAFCVCFALNGLAQSTGWPGTTKIVAQWTEPATRGRTMGAWSTCYQVGGIAATALATWLLGHHGWRAAFYAPAAWLAANALLVTTWLPQARERVSQDAELDTSASNPAASASEREALEAAAVARAARALVRDATQDAAARSPHPDAASSAGTRALRTPALYAFGASYFCIKLIRYSLLFWLPFYLHTAGGFDEVQSGYLSIGFEVGGVAGSVGIGYLSDRWRESRSLVAALSLAALALALYAYASVALHSALWHFSLLAAVGALLFGPDALVSGAAAQEAAGPRAAGTAVGLVNGLGSAGALLQGALTIGVQRVAGWDGVFYSFVALALAAAGCLLPNLRRRPDAVPYVAHSR